MTWFPDTPYNDLPALPPPSNLQTPRVFTALIKARTALAGLNEALVSLPNPSVFLQTLSLLEAQASSEIESIVTTTDDLFRAATLSETATPATKEALRYRVALFRGLDAMRDRQGILTGNTAATICTALRGTETSIRSTEGTFIGNPATGRRIYTPPEGTTVIHDKLSEWEKFVNEPSELDPLVRIALSHYQFEAIHPFDDGNGRTGRILNALMMVSYGLLSEPILYISQGVIARKNDYYRLLNAVTAEQAWEDWTVFMVEVVGETAVNTLDKIKKIQRLQGELRESLPAQAPAGLVDLLFAEPYCRIRDVVEKCEVTRPTATKYLNDLVEQGVLAQERAGREKLFINIQFMEILRGVRESF